MNLLAQGIRVTVEIFELSCMFMSLLVTAWFFDWDKYHEEVNDFYGGE